MKSLLKSVLLSVAALGFSPLAQAQICSPAVNQFANPQITNANPNLNMVLGQTYPVLFRFANTGDPDIVPANTLEILISMPDNVKMEFQPPYIQNAPVCGIWTVVSGAGDYILLRNTGGTTVASAACDIRVLVKAKQINQQETYSVAVNRIASRASCVGDADPSAANNTKDAYLKAVSTTPLPVKLASFTATAKGCDAMLTWTTASEQNFDRFEVEYSADGAGFNKVGEVANNNKVNGSTYSFSYAQANNNKGFYRLRMVDMDGATTFSSIVTATTHCSTGTAIKVYPNPGKDILHINGMKDQSVVRIYNATGSLVKEIKGAQENEVINIASWVSGIYQISIIDGSDNSVSNVTFSKL